MSIVSYESEVVHRRQEARAARRAGSEVGS